ncbi:hypothetical protein ACFOY8_14650 [Thalassospira xianhensis]|uniref:Uncharacterized protein n=1 Tax=Thalassospira xianhensis MCCC 1A02616 TaxID=1177929 RepID=A0A367UKG6_9PROT|nr:hypothetical protein [Thalassospira xianhensis]RCK07612.1 hypothetical protein TH5_00590 [Thalassospira xianhensis MCCC 1A02616]
MKAICTEFGAVVRFYLAMLGFALIITMVGVCFALNSGALPHSPDEWNTHVTAPLKDFAIQASNPTLMGSMVDAFLKCDFHAGCVQELRQQATAFGREAEFAEIEAQSSMLRKEYTKMRDAKGMW